MRIGFFTDNYLPTRDGIGISIETFRKDLEALGHEVFIIAPKPNFRYKEASKHVIRFPAIKGIFYEDYLTSMFFPPQAIRRIDKLNLDIVHFHTPGVVGLLGAYYANRSKLPLVTTYHTDLIEYVRHYKNVLPGIIVLSMLAPMITGGGREDYRAALSSIKPERDVDRWNQKVVERGLNIIHNSCDELIAPSLKIKRMLEKWPSKTPITILPTGVDKLPVRTRDIAAWRKKLDLPEGTPVILFVGRLGGEKNLDLLLKAFPLIHAKIPDVRLLVVGGTGSQTETSSREYMDAAHALPGGDQIIFTGYIDHDKLGAIYGLATVFAFPSLTDTQALVVHEAARSGLPIVMIDRDITEVVNAGENGFFAKATPKDFAANVVKILESPDLQTQMGLRSIELAAQQSARQQAEKLLRLYAEVTERHYAAKAKPSKRLLPWRRQSGS